MARRVVADTGGALATLVVVGVVTGRVVADTGGALATLVIV
ncbi:MAG: hypothetical protein JWP76_310, partial [Dactylosporangium sp.]|nr:hypothetical protein [Dactylosporangium sp.]